MAAPIQIGRYVLHDVIASGGMASVHFGRLVGPAGFSKTVAIKRLHRPFARMPGFREMILEEGRLAARIRHPNVVPPLDVLAEGGELLLVMEYVHGESLSRLCKAAWAQNERVPLSVAAALFAQVLHGLHAAHEARDEAGSPLGIVHRDVSPQNVIVGTDGQARVIDFGIAKAVTSGEHTSTGTIKGKVPYLAPEQLEGEQATRRTDVWAAAVCFWEILANRRLFVGEDDSETLRQIMEMPIPPPSTHNEQVPQAVDAIVLRALDRDPNMRFPTAREMAVAIETTMPLATATQVGAWAERLAAVKLGERAATLARVEQTPADIQLATVVTPTPMGSAPRSISGAGESDLHTARSPHPSESMRAPRTSYSPQVDMIAAPPP
ncbi:MAG TPA: serine/threonine-protein kinase, partial [Labilithrix sp.]